MILNNSQHIKARAMIKSGLSCGQVSKCFLIEHGISVSESYIYNNNKDLLSKRNRIKKHDLHQRNMQILRDAEKMENKELCVKWDLSRSAISDILKKGKFDKDLYIRKGIYFRKLQDSNRTMQTMMRAF